MKILVTGAKGFIGKNLIAELDNRGYKDLYSFDSDSDPELLDRYTKDCEFVFHLAGINRPLNAEEFMQGNYGFTSTLLESLRKNHNDAAILVSSSIQAAIDNPYGRSKKAGEDVIIAHSYSTGAKVMIYRLQNVFGKWSRPNYNSAVATFCYNIAHDLPIQVNDAETILKLIYIDDVVNEFINALEGNGNKGSEFYQVKPVYKVPLGRVAEMLYSFKEKRQNLEVPFLRDEFAKKLYSTYTSFLPTDGFSYPLKTHADGRGSFTEFIRTPDRGQVSVNVSFPGITKGNHWHHTKNEKFLVVSGSGVIKFRRVGDSEVYTYHVNGDNPTVVDIPCGYTHCITNNGNTNMITIMWANEPFDPQNPDTFYLEV